MSLIIWIQIDVQEESVEDDILPSGLQPDQFFAMSKSHAAKEKKKKKKKKTKTTILNKISPPRAEFLIPGYEDIQIRLRLNYDLN